MAPDYYVAAGGIIRRGDEVLLLYKPKLNEFVLPKGHVEAGETLEQTAVREVQEETGYGNVRILALLGEPQPLWRETPWSAAFVSYVLLRAGRTSSRVVGRPSSSGPGMGGSSMVGGAGRLRLPRTCAQEVWFGCRHR